LLSLCCIFFAWQEKGIYCHFFYDFFLLLVIFF
jgi:hypothetical protein